MAKLLTKRKKPRSYAKYTLTVPVQVYELLREGLELNAVAKTMGIRVGTLTHWIKKHPELQDAVGKALTLRKGDSSDTLRHFIYGRLSPRCQKLWNRIMASEEDTTQLERVKALIYQKPKVMRQQLFFYAFVARNFNLSEACRLIGISKRQLDHWVEEDKAFRDLMEEFHWHKGNFFESALVGLVAQGDSSATIFANKTFNRNRGYGEKIQHEHSGTIDHQHTIEAVKVDDLDLPLEVRRQILEALRHRNAALEDKSKEIQDADFEVKTPEPVPVTEEKELQDVGQKA